MVGAPRSCGTVPGRGAPRRSTLAALALCFVSTPFVFAASPPSPAHWTLTGLPAKPLAPGAKFRLQLTARIDPGWHLYALEEPENGPVATDIGLAEEDPVTLLRVDQSAPRHVQDPFYHQQTAFFEEAAAFTLQLQLPRQPLPHTSILHVRVRYQSCNDKLCLPPRVDSVELPLAPLLR